MIEKMGGRGLKTNKKGKLQLAEHSAVEGVCHIELKSNSERLLNAMPMTFSSLAKPLQTLTLAKRQKLHRHPGTLFFLIVIVHVHVCLQKFWCEVLIH